MEYSKEDLMEAKKQIWGVGENMGTEESKKIWEENAQFWDNAMGDESNEFHREVVRPKVTELLSPNPADYILDIACGNGNYSSYLAQRGASVVAFDYSKKMIELAKRRQSQYAKQIEFCVADATDRKSILELKRNRAFTKAVSNMAIMDITDIEPLLMAVYELLQESGIFVFATQHPCFVTLTEKYMTPHSYYDIAIEGQPKEQIYYHRSIQDIFNLCFRAGFVIDGFYEECFKTNKEIPMVMIVRLILENREYTGCLVNFKTEKLSYKVKHSVENPPEKQVIFENHHEPIIDTQTWERVQELRKQRKRPNRYDEVGLFSGILFCADCGSVMYQQRYQTDKRKQDCYICGNYKKRTHDCTAHFIRTDLLTAGVLSNLRKVTSYAAKHEARFMKLLIEQNEDGGKRRNAAKKKELEAAEKRIAELSAIFKRLYEDSVTGRISDERFTELSADYEAEQRELKERAAAIQAELSKAQEATVNAEKFMNVVRRHTSFEELTPTLLREFVEKIVVHECSYDENKTRRQDIEIYYSFVGKVDLPE